MSNRTKRAAVSHGQNSPAEMDLLRRVASAARWAIEANGDDVVGKDGRARVGLNWVMANGALNRALQELKLHYDLLECHEDGRQEAAEMDAMMRPRRKNAQTQTSL